MALCTIWTIPASGPSRTPKIAVGGQGNRDSEGKPRKVPQGDVGARKLQWEIDEIEQEIEDGAGKFQETARRAGEKQ
jgi:hypothetical protein